MAKSFTVSSRIWISGENGTYLGAGRVRLLHEIESTGSISEAARKLGMSYKKAWMAIDAMNREAETPLVQKAAGGKNGGGALVTQAGKDAVKQFEELEAAIEHSIAGHLSASRITNWLPEDKFNHID